MPLYYEEVFWFLVTGNRISMKLWLCHLDPDEIVDSLQRLVILMSFSYICQMDIEALREYCLSKKAATEDFPFGEDTLVFRVMNKIFLLVSLSSTPLQFNAKCDPGKAIELREQYNAVQPGYHMNKKHWNTIVLDGSLSNTLVKEMIDDSYNLIVQSLPKKEREALL